MGETTREFNDGKRARHVPPFRFYLVVSFLFFFLIFPSQTELAKIPNRIRSDAPATLVASAPDGASEPGFIKSLDAAITRKAERPAETISALLHSVPKALLICVPLFALLTRWIYRKSGYVYIQHLVLAFNLHSFVFLWAATTLGWSKLVGLAAPALAGWLTLASVAFTVWTYYRTLNVVFPRAWGATLLRGTFAAVAYGFLLLAVVIFAAIVVIMH